ncbi:MAG: L,D-transpeptidase family protein [Patescibacteria group bacterium]|nr:L,D-transpeptidase family protein [Patescibacteria group bacterium]
MPDKNTMGYWLEFKQLQKENGITELEVSLSREQIKGYLQSVANQINISPKNKKVNIRNGVSSVEQEGQNGKSILLDPAVEKIFSTLNSSSVSVNLQSEPIAFKTETNRSIGLDYGNYIEINLSSQRLWAYQDNKSIFSTAITSGATGAGFPTVTGLFSIYAKERGRYLNGRPYGWDYNVYVDYWMPFSGGYGLHDADWRSTFGGQDYYYGGSHGCVNMPKSSAAFIYGWASVGTPVWVHY